MGQVGDEVGQGFVVDHVGQAKDQVGQGQDQELDNIPILFSSELLILKL